MRSIKVPEWVLRRYLDGPIQGVAIEFAVSVDWPELQLTEDQMVANAIARAWDKPVPFPNHSIFSVVLPIIEGACGVESTIRDSNGKVRARKPHDGLSYDEHQMRTK